MYFYHKIFIVVTAFLDEDEYTVSEADGALEVCVVLDGFIDREVTVNLSTVDETAIGISSFILLYNYIISVIFNLFIMVKILNFMEVFMFVKQFLYFYMVKPKRHFVVISKITLYVSGAVIYVINYCGFS